MPDNPITLSAKSRRNLYLSTREQVTKDNPEILPDFDRLHNLQMQEFPRLHEFRLGWLCGAENALLSQSTSTPEKRWPPENVIISRTLLTAWADAVLIASARINALESLLTKAHNNLIELTGDIPPA